ncbi:MAG: hypothetical protein B6I19_00975 [Bacteroidetes bacterium 4572_114]|nr:MAG: hypothetical protein B6I19_00975 [Bacteroidetes bacterium 4572_114]
MFYANGYQRRQYEKLVILKRQILAKTQMGTTYHHHNFRVTGYLRNRLIIGKGVFDAFLHIVRLSFSFIKYFSQVE